MNEKTKSDERIENMTFGSVFPHYLAKIERKGRNVGELYEVIEWLTGFNSNAVEQIILEKLTFKDFFEKATLNENVDLVTGRVCGHSVEVIKNPLTQKVRVLDKLVDEIAKGKALDKILRT